MGKITPQALVNSAQIRRSIWGIQMKTPVHQTEENQKINRCCNFWVYILNTGYSKYTYINIRYQE
jgi:hypothetical protein